MRASPCDPARPSWRTRAGTCHEELLSLSVLLFLFLLTLLERTRSDQLWRAGMCGVETWSVMCALTRQVVVLAIKRVAQWQAGNFPFPCFNAGVLLRLLLEGVLHAGMEPVDRTVITLLN